MNSATSSFTSSDTEKTLLVSVATRVTINGFRVTMLVKRIRLGKADGNPTTEQIDQDNVWPAASEIITLVEYVV